MKTVTEIVLARVEDVRKRMQAKKINFMDLSEASGVHHQTIRGILNHGRMPTPTVIDKLVEALGAPKEKKKRADLHSHPT